MAGLAETEGDIGKAKRHEILVKSGQVATQKIGGVCAIGLNVQYDGVVRGLHGKAQAAQFFGVEVQLGLAGGVGVQVGDNLFGEILRRDRVWFGGDLGLRSLGQGAGLRKLERVICLQRIKGLRIYGAWRGDRYGRAWQGIARVGHSACWG